MGGWPNPSASSHSTPMSPVLPTSYSPKAEGVGNAHGRSCSPSNRKKRSCRRPTKAQRESYRLFIQEVEENLRRDPVNFDVDAVHVPAECCPQGEANEFLTGKAR